MVKKAYWQRLARSLVGICTVLVLCSALSGCSPAPLGQTTTTFEEAFAEDVLVQKGIASSSYLNESPYEVKSFTAENIEKRSETGVTADFSATIENDNFMTEMSGTATYLQEPDGPSTYEFDVVSSETTPKKGIDFDKSNGLEHIDPVLSDDRTSCMVEIVDTFSYWFADSSVKHLYTYQFDGSRWALKSDDVQHEVTYKDIDGNYLAKTGDLTKVTLFDISNLDAATGSFDVAYRIGEYSSGYQNMLFHPEINGTLKATIEPALDGKNDESDKYTYKFKAVGTSDRGNGKEATFEGYFSTNEFSEKIIQITSASISSEEVAKAQYSFASDHVTTPVLKLEAGVLYKQ